MGVSVADQLKERSRQVEVKVILDRLGTIGGGAVPPGTPMPEDFVAPTSIYSYLKEDSRVRVHPFLNPWFSSDHSKVFLVDGTHAWMGGMNLGREYRYEWHDLMVELQGPVVASLEDEFRHDWAHESLLGDLAYVAELARGPRDIPPSRPEDRWIKTASAAHQDCLEAFQRRGAGGHRQIAKLHLPREPLPVRQAGDHCPGARAESRGGCARRAAARQ